MIFQYTGFDKNGKKIKRKIEASDIEEAKTKIRTSGILYKNIKESDTSIFEKFAFLKVKKLNSLELSKLSKNLAIYLKSGVSLVNAIKLSKSLYESDKKILDFLSSVETLLEEGKSFYVALETQKIIYLPDFYKHSIKVSEDRGLLTEILFELSKYIKEQERVNKQIKTAFIYPSFIVVVSVLMIAFMLTSVVPKITSIFDSIDQELPKSTQFVIAMGDFFSSYWLYLLIGIFCISLLFTILYKLNKSFRYFTDKSILKIPIFGKVAKTAELARFSYIASVLLRSGVPFIHSIKLSSEILNNSLIKEKFYNAATKVVEGGKLSQALAKETSTIDKSFIQAIALAEETSEMENILKNLSELYFEQNQDKTAMLLSLLEPTLMLVVGGVVGFIVTAMLLSIFYSQSI